MFRIIQTKISFSRQGSIQYFRFTEYTEFKTKQVPISCFASRDKFKLPIYQSCRQIDQNYIFATRVINPIHSFYQIQIQIDSDIMFATRNSRDKFKPPIYQTSRHGSFQYFHFTEYETKQVHISCFASRDIEENGQPSY